MRYKSENNQTTKDYFSKENQIKLEYEIWKLFKKENIEPPSRLLPAGIIEGSTAKELFEARKNTIRMAKSLKEKRIIIKQ